MAKVKVELVGGGRAVRMGTATAGLAEWPPFFDGLQRAQAWDPEGGAYREELPAGVQQLELPVRVRGGDVTAQVDELLAVAGADPVLFRVTSGRGGVRELSARLVEVGGVQWHPEPYSAVFAEVPLRFETVDGAWLGRKRTAKFTQATGRVLVPYGGDVVSWPVVRVRGTHGGVKVRMHKADTAQSLPSNTSGWTIYTEPARRAVYDGARSLYRGVVPFWPEPPAVRDGNMELYVTATAPGADFQVTVETQEKWRKAWA